MIGFCFLSVSTTPQGHHPGFLSGSASGYPSLFNLDLESGLKLPRYHDLVIQFTPGFA